MKKIFTFIIIMMCIFTVNVKAGDAMLLKMEAIEEKLDVELEKIDDTITIKAAEGLLEDYHTENNIPTPYEDFVMGMIKENIGFYAESVFGDKVLFNTGETDYFGNVIAMGYIRYDFPNNKYYAGYEYTVSSNEYMGDGNSIEKEITLNVDFVEPDLSIMQIINSAKQNMINNKKNSYSDLYWINNLLATNLGGINVKPQIKDFQYLAGKFTNLTEGMTINLNNNKGYKNPIEVSFSGDMLMYYNGVLYDIFNCKVASNPSEYYMFYFSSVIDIPNTTEDDKIVETVENRIKDYINNSNYEVKVTKTDTLTSTLANNLLHEELITTSEEYIYNLNIKIKGSMVEADHLFLVQKVDPRAISEPVVNYLDGESNIIMETTSSDIPLNSKINVTAVDTNSNRQEQIELYLDSNRAVAYDIELQTYKGLLTAVNNGKVTVKIPLPEGFNESSTVINYVSDDGQSGEQFDVRFETINGIRYIVFDTAHFSTYVVTEKINNPQTSDNITYYMITAILSMIGLSIYYKRNKKLS